MPTCFLQYSRSSMVFSCPGNANITSLPLHGYGDLSYIKYFKLHGQIDRGPLTFIPENICNLTNLTVKMNKNILFIYFFVSVKSIWISHIID